MSNRLTPLHRAVESRRRFLTATCAAVGTALLANRTSGQEGGGTQVRETKSRWKFGFEVVGQGAPTRGIQASFPTPMEWPDQAVELVDEERSSAVRAIREDVLSGGVRQVTASIPLLGARETARLVRTYEVTRRLVRFDGDASWYLPSGEKLDGYLGVSPMIETDDREIRKVAESLTDLELSSWRQAERTYDWVRENVDYKFDPQLKGAKRALDAGVGDCEELTSLFIAICRNQGIPARSVWVPGHCYPEFYLEDAAGEGRWIPCQAAGTRQFGTIDEVRPILQKGDSFTPPGAKEPIRYVAGSFSATDAPVPPTIEFFTQALS